MEKKQFKKVYRRLRLITGARLVGTHGHLSDLVKEFKVTMPFLRELRELREKPKKLVYGRYTTEYQERENQVTAWESYGERIVGA